MLPLAVSMRKHASMYPLHIATTAHCKGAIQQHTDCAQQQHPRHKPSCSHGQAPIPQLPALHIQQLHLGHLSPAVPPATSQPAWQPTHPAGPQAKPWRLLLLRCWLLGGPREAQEVKPAACSMIAAAQRRWQRSFNDLQCTVAL